MESIKVGHIVTSESAQSIHAKCVIKRVFELTLIHGYNTEEGKKTPWEDIMHL